MERAELIEKFSEFLNDFYLEELVTAATEEKKSISVDFAILDKFNVEITDYFFENPNEVISAAEEALKRIDTGLTESDLKIRFYNLPDSKEIRIRKLRSEHIGRIVVIDGIVKRASEIRPELSEAVFRCPDCDNRINVIQEDRSITAPEQCDCGCKRGFKLIDQTMYDTRWVTIEEPFEITTGEQPSELTIFLKEDMTSPTMQNHTDPGNRIKVIGILKSVPRRTRGSGNRQFELYLEANNIEPVEVGWEEINITAENERELIELSKDPLIYDKLVKSIAPTIYGLNEIKEAIVLQMFGGESHILKDKTKVRSNIHILLVGDPSTAKSRIMQLVSLIMPRGKYASGTGITGAGLCTVYDTLVQLENGTITKIGKLVEEKFENTKNVNEIDDGVCFVEPDENEKVSSFDQDSLKMKSSRITKYWKIKAPENLVKIVTRTGREVIVTPDNPIPVIKNSKIIWKCASDVTPENYIATPRILKSKIKEIENNISSIPKKSWILNSNINMDKINEKIKTRGTIRNFCNRLGLNENDIYHNWKYHSKTPQGTIRRGAPTIGEIKMICDELDMDIEDVIPSELLLSQYRGHEIKLPLFVNNDILYMMGLLAGDGSISKTGMGGFDIKFFNTDTGLLNAYKNICHSKLGMSLSEKEIKDVPYLRFHSKIFGYLVNKFGITHGKKSHNIYISERLSKLPKMMISHYLKGVFDTDGSVIKRRTKGSNYVELTSSSKEFITGIHLLLLRYGIISMIRKRDPHTSTIKGREVKSDYIYELKISGMKNISKFRDEIGFNHEEKDKKLDEIIKNISRPHTNIDIIPEIGGLIRKSRKRAGLSAKELYGYKTYSYEKGRRRPTKRFLSKLIENIGEECSSELRKFAESDIFWDKVDKVETIRNDDHDYVYDITVEGDHSFMANGLIIHNTATVTKDEQFMGGWVLEAGALVLANRSICAIDEFSHVAPSDMVKLQEAMSMETISIAKASIVATLPAKTAILAGGNPKFGRFDPYLPIKEQLEIGDVLLSRFDLRFALRDVPSQERDEKIAEHIMNMRHFDQESARPVIDPELLRKYISYARINSHPKLTKEAAKKIKEFYLNMRSKSGEESPVSITLRQYDSLIRLAEASAKVRLDNKVREEDAQRAINLMSASLRQFGFEPETGKIDIDRVEGQKMTASQRSKTKIMLDIISKLESEMGKDVPKDEIIKRGVSKGVKNAEEIVRKLLQMGELYQPQPGIVRRVKMSG